VTTIGGYPVEQLDEFRWRLPMEGGMRVPGLLFADRELLEKMLSDRTPEQVKNAAHLPGILEASIAMPDAHWGYGLPVGGVVAMDEHEGVVSPGAVGYDIGCGVRLMSSRLARADVEPHVERLADALYRNVPCGVGSHGAVTVSQKELERVLRDGARWAVKRGMGTEADLEHCEEGGVLEGARPDAVSDGAKNRGKGQLGTLGSGNHFLEVQEVDEVVDASPSTSSVTEPSGDSAVGSVTASVVPEATSAADAAVPASRSTTLASPISTSMPTSARTSVR